MQTVNLFTEVEHTPGALGYSILARGYFRGDAKRMTMLFLRDSDGYMKAAVIAPAEQLVGVIY